MSMTMKENIANRANYGSKRSGIPKYIVIHFTSNDGDTDENNGKYFHNNIVKASAHYFVDSDSCTLSVPLDYVAYHCGGSVYSGTPHKYHGLCTNSNSIGIELCDDYKNGVIYPSEATIQNAVTLTKSLMEKYGIDANHVIRHYDVTGKSCPAYWVNDTRWNNEFKCRLTGAQPVTITPTAQPASSTPSVKSYLSKGDQGTAVKTMQTMLNTCGYSCGTADGIFGAKTLTAVKNFQRDHGLTVDGKYGAKSKAKLESVYAAKTTKSNTVNTSSWVCRLQSAVGTKVDGIAGPKTIAACPVLKQGSKGTTVKLLQERLNAKGFNCGTADGIFGAKTTTAVKNCQAANGLTRDGIVGKNTWTFLVR